MPQIVQTHIQCMHKYTLSWGSHIQTAMPKHVAPKNSQCCGDYLIYALIPVNTQTFLQGYQAHIYKYSTIQTYLLHTR